MNWEVEESLKTFDVILSNCGSTLKRRLAIKDNCGKYNRDGIQLVTWFVPLFKLIY